MEEQNQIQPRDPHRTALVVIDMLNEYLDPIGRFFRKSSILRKFVVYAFSHLQRAHETHFGFTAPARVLIATTNKKQIEAMQNSVRTHLNQRPLVIRPGLLLFTGKTNSGLWQWVDSEDKAVALWAQ